MLKHCTNISSAVCVTLFTAPLLGEKDDGSIKDFDYVWDGTKKNNGLNYHTRTSTLSDGFQHYMNDYYFDAKVGSKLMSHSLRVYYPDNEYKTRL